MHSDPKEEFQVIDTGYDFERQILEDKATRKKKRIFFGLCVFVLAVTICGVAAVNHNSLMHEHGTSSTSSSTSSSTEPSSASSDTTSPTTTRTTDALYILDTAFSLTGLPEDYDVSFCKAVAVNREKLYVGQDVGTPKVMVFDEYGNFETGWEDSGLISAHGMKVHDDSLWVVDTDDHVVKQFSLDGELLNTLGVEGESGSTTDPLMFDRPTDVEFDASGNMYISDGEGVNDRIIVLNSDLEYTTHWGSSGSDASQFDVPHALAYQEEGNRLWVTDEHNNRVQVFNLDYNAFVGEWTDDQGCSLYEPKGIALDGGYVLISTTDDHDIPANLNVYPWPRVEDGSDLFHWESCDEVEEETVSSNYYHNLAAGEYGVYAVDPYDGKCLHRYIQNF